MVFLLVVKVYRLFALCASGFRLETIQSNRRNPTNLLCLIHRMGASSYSVTYTDIH